MTAGNFTIDMRDDGGGRLSLSYTGPRQHGISRISCDIVPSGMVQLVLFEGAISLQNTLGTVRRTELALDGLVLRYGTGDAGLLCFDRQLGFSSQTAFCPLKDFHAEMADATDVCLARAETAKHGALLQDILAQCPLPDALLAGRDPDTADQIFHRLREMALLILAEEITSRQSALTRKLRGKKTQQDAADDIHAVLRSLVSEFAFEEGFRQGNGTTVSPGS
ncbi:MAG TPA: hypothetical protein VIN05_12750 [Roseovarius sp.]